VVSSIGKVRSSISSVTENVSAGYSWLGQVVNNKQGCEAGNGTWILDLTTDPGGCCKEPPPPCPRGQTATSTPSTGSCGSSYICTNVCGLNEEYHEVADSRGACRTLMQERDDGEICDDFNPCPEPENLMTIADCRANGYRDPSCRRNQKLINQHAEDVGTISETRLALAEACRQSSVRVGSSCSTYSQEAQAIGGGASSAGGNACALAQAAPASQGTVNEKQSSCQQQQRYCEDSCNQTQTVLWDTNVSGSANAGLCGRSASPHIQAMQRQIQALAANQAQSQKMCDQIAGKPDADPTAQAAGSPAAGGSPPPAAAASNFEYGNNTTTTKNNTESEMAGGGSGMGNALTSLGGLASGLAGSGDSGGFDNSFPESQSYGGSNTAGIESGYSGNSGNGAYKTSSNGLNLAGNGSSGDDMRGLSDDPRDTAPIQTGFDPNAQQGRPGSGNAGVGGANTNPQSAMLASTDGQNNNDRRRGGTGRNSVAGRSLISGYKNVKPSDGGGSLSIRPSDMKKYGYNNMKAKLNAARKTFGLKVPLMFKNGKFVRDFLALKEGKGFKSRQAAMESYWKGNNIKNGVGEHACVSLNQCHTNEKASIFKLMNFRLQKSFYKMNIDI